MLLNKDTSEELRIEIIKELRASPDNSQQMKIVLTQLSQKGIDKEKNPKLWIIVQSEWRKVKKAELEELNRNVDTLPIKFYVDSIAYLLTAISGGVLIFTPIGQTAFIVGKGTLKALGVLLGTIAGIGGLSNINYFLSEEDQKNISFFTEFIKINPLVGGVIHLLSATDENDKYLAERLSQASTLEDFITELVHSIGDDKYSIPTQEAVINALRGFSDIEEDLRIEAIENLKHIIKNSTYPSLKEFSVSALGEIGEGVEGVAEYLISLTDADNENDELRFLALVELGRDKYYFLTSIEKLSEWFEEIANIEDLLIIQPEIPDSFLDSLLMTTQAEHLEQHIIVVKSLIRSGILEFDLKLEFSETLLNWDDSPENKTFLREVYLNPVEDIKSYIKQELSKKRLSAEDHKALKFLTAEINGLADNKTAIEILYEIELIMGKLEIQYPNQVEIALKLENIVDSYKKVLESIQN